MRKAFVVLITSVFCIHINKIKASCLYVEHFNPNLLFVLLYFCTFALLSFLLLSSLLCFLGFVGGHAHEAHEGRNEKEEEEETEERRGGGRRKKDHRRVQHARGRWHRQGGGRGATGSHVGVEESAATGTRIGGAIGAGAAVRSGMAAVGAARWPPAAGPLRLHLAQLEARHVGPLGAHLGAHRREQHVSAHKHTKSSRLP